MLTSVQNPQIKHLKKLSVSSKYRAEQQECVIENRTFITTALTKVPNQLSHIYTVDPSEYPEYLRTKCTHIDIALLKKVSTLKHPQNDIAIFRQAKIPKQLPIDNTPIIICDHIQQPSNMGAIIRNAAAFNARTIITIKSVDPYHPESVRASAGYCFHVPIREMNESLLHAFDAQEISVIAIDSNSTTSYKHMLKKKRVAFLFGSEGQGIQQGTKEKLHITQSVKIDMANEVESLNVAVSSGIILSEHMQKLLLNRNTAL